MYLPATEHALELDCEMASAAAVGGSGMAAEICRRNPKEVYKLMQRLGYGTYGCVYKGMKIATGELAAIKVCRFESGKLRISL